MGPEWFVCYLCWWLLVQVGVWIDVGSRYETEKNNGAGYFVEHLAFKVRPPKCRVSPGLRVPVVPPKDSGLKSQPPQLGASTGGNLWLAFLEAAMWA